MDLQRNISARDSILRSIRDHLAASAPHDAIHEETKELTAASYTPTVSPNGDLRETFKENLEAVGGHCIVAKDEAEAVQALYKTILDLQKTPLRARRIALSDSPAVERLFRQIQIDADEITIDPSRADIFGYDVGVSSAQYAIADTGTLVLQSDLEKHRLVSLVPPVHIAIVGAHNICFTLAEALAEVNQEGELSPAITMITGPSRTADIELTMAIGVHGPRELYVVII